ncbi:MAG: hypothetical protein KJ558_07305 [Gammaproteobacteria bacterium]|nr:hypothetical protein [Gammaproteobacteria bacterium]MBU1654624.1 hypothetical protein [Gammaproteobacteria bacterium]MBU1959954.1 hypothetical protein [Gammaproteobacteria bacterium]
MRVNVLAPANHATGGVEALHQLVDALRFHGQTADIIYMPEQAGLDVPEPYRKYDIGVSMLHDSPDTLVIVPETMFEYAPRLRYAKVLIWWLSIDCYYGLYHRSLFIDLIGWLYRIARGKVRPLRFLRRYRHAVQSEYAACYLARHGLASTMLSDYLNQELLAPIEPSTRQFRVLFNPKKGMKQTARIIRAMPEVEFMPLQGLDRQQLAALFRGSEVYIDFGHHPGKDRMPREAAVNGCIIVSNRRGGAASYNDLPIPDAYKIDDKVSGFEMRVAALLDQVRRDPEAARREFLPFVDHIHSQRAIFFHEVGQLVKSC